MKPFTILLLILAAHMAQSQVLQDINYQYLYDPNQPLSVEFNRVKTTTGWNVFFKVSAKEAVQPKFHVSWELRKSSSDKEASPVSDSLVHFTAQSDEGMQITGNVTLDVTADNSILVAKVTDIQEKRAWYYFTDLRADYPVNVYLQNESGEVNFKSYLKEGNRYSIKNKDAQELIVSYYTVSFPAGAPTFSEGMAPVASTIQMDSTLRVNTDSTFAFTNSGMYLIQKDTNDAKGVSFSVYNDYPKYTRIENLADPLVYVCTKNESDKLREAGSEKKVFDRIILSITGDAERARIFMRSYFKRVELANQYFNSFKEGWKTDRGMVYIIYGMPDAVYKFKDREVWNYNNSRVKTSFDFVRSGTLFDPDNYVLIRDKKYKETWYEIVDLWRNARF